MTPDPLERLQLPDPAGRLWTCMRDELRHEVVRRIPDFEGWALTGGTILAAQWGHRRSTDVDLKVPPRTGLAVLGPKYDPTFDEAMGRLGAGTPVHTDRQIIIPLFDGKIDILEAPLRPEAGQRPVEIDDNSEMVLSNTQILTGKLAGRGLESPTRDLFDVAVAHDLDPEALEVAVNCIPEDTWRETVARWRQTAQYHADQADLVLKDVADPWIDIAADPATAAAERAVQARYQRIVIEWRGDVLEVVTTCLGRNPRNRRVDSTDADSVVEDLQRHGIAAHLDHATRRPQDVFDRIEKARGGQGRRVVHATLTPPSAALLRGDRIDHRSDVIPNRTANAGETGGRDPARHRPPGTPGEDGGYTR